MGEKTKNLLKKPKRFGILILLGYLLISVNTVLTASCVGANLNFSPDQPNAQIQNYQKIRPRLVKTTKASFLAVGDILLSRGVHRAIEREGDPFLPFSKMEDLLCSTDFNFGNLESPVSGNERRLGKGLIFNTHAHDTKGLSKYNFKVVNLANNHALDQGLEGLRFTQKHLETQGIKYLGVGENKSKAWQPKIIEANGIKIGFVGASYSSINDGGSFKNNYVARIEEIDYLENAVTQLKSESDFVVVTFHAGVEYTRKPNQKQINFARAAVEAGADLVVGGHPHWIQTFEKYRGKYIYYSLGNFIFDQRKPDTKEGLTLQISLCRNEFEDLTSLTEIEKIELIPVISESLGIPRRATPKETIAILKKIGATESIIFP